MLGPKYISDLEDEYTNDVEEGYIAELIDMSDGEPGGILSLGFLTQSTEATKLKSNFHSFQNYQ